MKCSICGYESNTAFSICPCCGNENASSSATEIKSNSSNQTPTNTEIQEKDVKLPFGFKKNFIEKKGNNFVINAVTGGDIFPNKDAATIGCTAAITIIISILCGMYFFNSDNPTIGSIFFFIGFSSSFMTFILITLTNVKTKFDFSTKGINITSKKGSLFIPQDNVQNILIDHTYGNRGSNKYYFIFIEVYQEVYIPHTKKNLKQITLLDTSNNLIDKKGKLIADYIVQETKKVLCINY